jgi:predicted nucleic acid-binding protein
MMHVAIIDSSCLINLTHLQLAPKLSLYFGRVYVPRRVQEEVNKKRRFRHRLRKLYESGFFQRCACADETRVQLLLAGKLGGGEAEGLVQAQEQSARFFIADDRPARDQAARQGLTAVGTVRLLARLCSEGYAEDVTLLVARLRRDLKFRIDDDLVASAIADAHKPIRG